MQRIKELPKIKAVLIDLSGTLHIDDEPTQNAIEALQRLRSIDHVQLRFVTNTTKESKETLLNRLHRIGFSSINKDDLFTSLSAAVQFVQSHQLKPYYLLSEDAKKDFILNYESNVTNNNEVMGDEDSVVVGLAPDKFNYESMNRAFRILTKSGSHLIAVHEAKYFKRSDGLAIGPGCFTRGLAYSTGKKATVIGKPNQYFFNNAIPEGLSPAECCMIGDDITDDVFGALDVGMKGILVKTGKYIENIESNYLRKPTHIADSFADAVEFLINSNFHLEEEISDQTD